MGFSLDLKTYVLSKEEKELFEKGIITANKENIKELKQKFVKEYNDYYRDFNTWLWAENSDFTYEFFESDDFDDCFENYCDFVVLKVENSVVYIISNLS